MLVENGALVKGGMGGLPREAAGPPEVLSWHPDGVRVHSQGRAQEQQTAVLVHKHTLTLSAPQLSQEASKLGI
jgi:hypothetical protein